MKKMFRALFSGLFLGLTACLTVMELIFAWTWLQGTLYVRKYGALENPYAAEDAEIAGVCALLLLPLVLTALAWTVYRTISWCKDRAEARSER